MKDNKDDKIYNKVREIEFRAKDVDDNKWVYGTPAIISRDYWMIEKNAYMEYGEIYDMYAIKQETLGQFTGLCDKDGKKIYEGDIVKLEKGYWGGTYNYVLIEENENYAVYYDKYGRFDLKTEDKDLQFKSVAWHQLVEGNVEVIGNIYDNPELLGGSDEECDN